MQRAEIEENFNNMTAPKTLRLSLDPADIALLTQHPLLNVVPKRRRIHQTCFDTAEHTLSGLGLIVEETRILRKTTLSVRETTKNGHEWSAPTTSGSFDFATLIDTPAIAEQLAQLAPKLIPRYAIDVGQRLWSVQIRSAQVDITLEDGTLTSGTGPAVRSTRLCEVEVRLNNGQPAALYGIARLLSRQLRLHPIAGTLAQRAIAFSTNEGPRPAKAKRVKIDPKSTVISVFKQISWHCLDQLQANEGGVFSTDNVEYIHQARVALRRLRTALRLFNSTLPPGFSDKWSQAWRNVGEQLGNARNWDVFCSEILPTIAADLGDHLDVRRLKEFSVQKRKEAHAATQHWLRDRRYSLTMIAFCEALLTLPEQKGARIGNFADKALKKRHKSFCHGAHIAHTLSAEERHEVRIDLKKLRYTLDFFESLYGQKQLQPFLKGLTETQELLGHMNDLATAEILLASRPGKPFDLPVAWTRGRMSAYIEMLPGALKPVLAAQTPW